MTYNSRYTSDGLLIIETARSTEAINEAANLGLWPVVKPVEPMPGIFTKYTVFQNNETGEIVTARNFNSRSNGEGWKTVIPFTRYYPHHWENPFAAYLVPKHLQIGDRVLLEDLIQDLVGSGWNQGDRYRLRSCEAVWNGEDFDLDYDGKNIIMILG